VARTSAGPWFVARHDGVVAGLKAVDRFVGTFGSRESVADDERIIQAIPEPRHGKMRRIMSTVLAPSKIAKATPFIRELCARLMDDVVAAPKCELVRAYVDPIPTTVIAHVLGIPTADWQQFKRWSDHVVEGLDPRAVRDQERIGSLSQRHPEFAAYLDDQIAQRHAAAEPPDDIIARFIRTEIDGERLSDVAIRTQLMVLIIAGNETTRNLIGNAFHTLAGDPGLYARLRTDRSIIPTVVEESLRHDSPVQILTRTCTQNTAIEGVEIPADDAVVFGVGSANRDERYYEEPAAFRLDRPDPWDHVAFGAGPHICPGAALARLEAAIALEVFSERVERVTLAPGYAFDPNPVFWAHGPRSLAVRIVAQP
jgi:cytochrome P450